jgi:hypothetical protein
MSGALTPIFANFSLSPTYFCARLCICKIDLRTVPVCARGGRSHFRRRCWPTVW